MKGQYRSPSLPSIGCNPAWGREGGDCGHQRLCLCLQCVLGIRSLHQVERNPSSLTKDRLHACTHTRTTCISHICTFTQSHLHTHSHMNTHPLTLTHSLKTNSSYLHTHTGMHPLSQRPTLTHTNIHLHMHTFSHTCMHTLTHDQPMALVPLQPLAGHSSTGTHCRRSISRVTRLSLELVLQLFPSTSPVL